jgi:hypothetical protein
VNAPLRVLVACEYSATVRDAFRARGHDAWSCDLLPTEGDPAFHVQGDVVPLLTQGWDMMIAHPPCTFLCRSGAAWWNKPGRAEAREDALSFVRLLLAAPIPRIAIENPPGAIGSRIRKADQYVQPWQFGHGEVKMTGLWLKGLPMLRPTNIVDGRHPRLHLLGPSPDRWKERSRTFPGIAAAMADQWGGTALATEAA